ncbi:hypothetical protein [Pseudomonas sp. EA_15y_Pfl1_P101]|uniref:hypothetical protein n=1 Tax=Pseudomonas sp. EA_15y_Pfl1_P101 TaxID=3088684 RepID=UPI0030D7FBA8
MKLLKRAEDTLDFLTSTPAYLIHVESLHTLPNAAPPFMAEYMPRTYSELMIAVWCLQQKRELQILVHPSGFTSLQAPFNARLIWLCLLQAPTIKPVNEQVILMEH